MILMCSLTFAQTVPWVNVNDTNSGLNKNMVSCIAQDNDKNMWIGMTNGSAFQYGLDKFDGINWTHFDKSNSGLPSDAVSDVVVDASNNIWISFNEKVGLCRYDGTTWTIFDTSNSNIPSNQIMDLTLSDNNELWLACEGVTKYTPDSFINYHYDPDIFGFIIETNFCYALTGGGNGFKVIDLITNSYQTYKTSNSNTPSNYPSSVAIDKNGLFWLGYSWAYDGGFGTGGSNGGLATFDGSDFIPINPFSSSSTWVYYNGSIVIDSSNHIWVSSRCEGLTRFDDSSWSQINEIPDNGCAGFMFIDIDNYIWYGDVYSGLWTNKSSLINSITKYPVLGEIFIYPNPASQNAILKFDNFIKETYSFALYDNLGRKVLTINGYATDQIEIERKHLTKGLYFYKLTVANQRLRTGKLVFE